MRYRQLGSTGITVSEIGFGAWGLGGDAYGPVDDEISGRALRQALDAGVTFYDTADLYGGGHSEAVLGSTFRDCRDKIVIATKVGTLPHTGFYMPQDFSAEHIRQSVEASLRRLQTEYIDLYQLHSPQLAQPNWDEILATLASLRQAGKIRAYGLSARSPADAKTAVEQFGFGVVQVNFNLIDQRAIETGLLALCRQRQVGVIARTPLAFGFLSGQLTGEETFPGRDHRNNWPREQLRRWAEAGRLFASLNDGLPRTRVQLALQFCLSDASVAAVIPGMLTPDEVRENMAVASSAARRRRPAAAAR
jgi:aryl-alcohol dehydrogenase-like predicted oxidoreductase